MANQYFRVFPTDQIVQKVLNAFHLKSLDDDRIITRDDILSKNCVENIIELTDELEQFYFPHKIKWVLSELNHKSIINVLRHFVKTRGYSVLCYGGKKTIVSYKLVKKNKDCQNYQNKTFNVIRKEVILTFN
jgi:hypothetical protein